MINFETYINNLKYISENAAKLKKNEIIDKINDIIHDYDFAKHSENFDSTNDFSYNTEELNFYEGQLMPIIMAMNLEIEKNDEREKPIKLNLSKYSERALSKLNVLFRKRQIISPKEAEENCNNFSYLLEKYNTFLELIDWINDHNVSMLVDRLLFCSYLGISLESYEKFLTSSDEKISSIFLSIENMYLSQKTNASEMGTRSNTAIKTNLSYDKVGSGLVPKDTNIINTKVENVLAIADILSKAKALGYTPQKNIIDADFTEENK